MLEKLRSIDNISSMDIFCNIHSSIPYVDINEKIIVEKEIFKRCFENDYHMPILNNYNTDKVMDLFRRTKDEFFIHAYIYSNNMMFQYEETLKIYRNIDIENIVNFKIYMNIVVALNCLNKYEEIIELTKGKKDIFSLFQRGQAYHTLNILGEAEKIYKVLEEYDMSNNDWIRLCYRFAEIDFLKGDIKSLKKRLKYLEENYHIELEEINCRAYYLSKYYQKVENEVKYIEFLKKAASINSYNDVNLLFKVRAIKELKEELSLYITKSFSEDYSNEDYCKEKEEFHRIKREKLNNYTII